MILTEHSDAGFNNETKAISRAGAHIFLFESESISRWNGPLLSIAQIMKYVMSLASEAEMGDLFLTSKLNGTSTTQIDINGMALTSLTNSM